jgi:hypothetical protein
MPLGDLEPVDPEHDRLWREEIERRYQEFKKGKAELWNAEEVIAEIEKARRPVGEI